MITIRFGAYATLAALLYAGVCAAQTVQPQPNTASLGAAYTDPLDLRVGAVRDAITGDSITDGGLRTAASRLVSMTVPPVSLGKDYRVVPNDLIEVEVLNLENLKRAVRVNAAGAISLPLIGRVQVIGLSAQEIEELIAARLGEKYLQHPQVTVFIKEFTTERLTIEGAVTRPGIYPLTGQITLLRALALAGGFGPIANSSQVMLYRVNDQREREVAVYDVEKIRAGKSEDPPIKGDDLIVVQRDSTRVLLKDSLFRDVIDSINPFSVLAPR